MTLNKLRDGFMGQIRKGSKSPVPFQGSLLYILAIFVGYMVADLTILSMRPAMFPTSAPPAKPQRLAIGKTNSRADYAAISRRNIFNANGIIPPPLATEGQGGEGGWQGPPVLSQLPLKLVGTIVHYNPDRSIATVLLSSKNETKSFKKAEVIEDVAELTKIERRKVIFKNLNSHRLEYIEMPEEGTITFGVKENIKAGEEVQQRGDNEFVINRGDLDRYTKDLTAVLKQARMVPAMGPSGEITGFKFVFIEPGSIYEKLGFKEGDTLKQVEGEPVNNPTKGLELYNKLKTNSSLTLVIERGGHEETKRYNIE